MKRLVLVGASLAWAASTSIATSAQAADLGGGAILQIEDASPHSCVDVANDVTSIQLATAQISRSQSWWKAIVAKKTALGVKFDVSITDAEGKAFNFPRVKQLNPPPGNSGIALLPMQVSVMSKYPLTAGSGKEYRNVSLDLYFITVEDRSDAMNTMNTVISFTKTLPIPTNPYVTGVDYFGKFVDQIVDTNIMRGAAPNPDAAFTFDLAAGPDQARQCPAGYLKQGVQAVLFDDPNGPGPSTISAADVSRYCFWFDVPTSRVQFAPRGGGACLTTAPGNAKRLDNPLVAFVVSALSATRPTPVAAETLSLALARPNDAGVAITHEQIADYTGRLNGSAKLSGVANAKNVQMLFDAMGKNRISDTDIVELSKTATTRDLAAAAALKRCAVAGIPAQECQ